MSNNLLCIYIAGPISGDTHTTLANIRRFHQTDYALTLLNFACYCPGHDFLRSFQGNIPIETYKAVSMAWLRKSDAVFVLPGWKESKGTLEEMREASKLGIPVFFEIEHLIQWRGETTGQEQEDQKSGIQEIGIQITVTDAREHVKGDNQWT